MVRQAHHKVARNLHAIVLAAGKGKRLNAELLPKVLYQLGGRPMILYVLELLAQVGITKPIVVVGFQGKGVIEALSGHHYVWQRRQLGTGHAVSQVRRYLVEKPGHTFIINGDNPLIQPTTLRRMVKRVEATGAAVAIASAKAPDDLGLGRLITDAYGHVVKIVEHKNATLEQRRKFRWKNAGPWLVENSFLWQALPKIKKNPVSKEYYLTDLLELAVEQGKRAIAVPVTNLTEAIGVNTLQHLKEAEKAYEESQNRRRHHQTH